MFRWNLMLRTLFGVRYDQAKARRAKTTTKLQVEWLEDRTVPSALLPNLPAIEAVASPPPASTVATLASPAPAPSVAAFTSYVFATMDHWFQFMATAEQAFVGDLTLVTQEFAQLESSVRQQVGRFFGNNSNAADPALNTTVTQPGNDIGMGRGNSSGSGSGKGAMTTANNGPNQPINQSTPKTGNGSGSGSSTTAHPSSSGRGGSVLRPMDSGSGSGSGGGSSSSGTATVNGLVWLDNNGDGSLDNGEMGFAGIKVLLLNNGGGSVYGSTTTNGSGNYQFTVNLGQSGNGYRIQVIPPSTWISSPTYPGPDSQVDTGGYSDLFDLSNGSSVTKNAGLLAMSVTTGYDDPTDPIQNQVTLRDAVETGNNGGGPLGFTEINFVNPLNGQALTGTVTLQKALDPLGGKYNIVGPGADNLTIQGQGNAANPFRIFDNPGGSRAISGLTISGGYLPKDYGGAILNGGDLKLSNDRISKNMASYGGGICVAGGQVTVSGGTISQNNTSGVGDSTPTGGGGIWVNAGSLTLNDVTVGNNHADNNPNKQQTGGRGGGLMIMPNGQVTISGGYFQYNTTANNGGGIYNGGGTLTLKNNVLVLDNTATNQGGGMYLNPQSTTTFKGCIVSSNMAVSGVGNGVCYQVGATLNGLPDGLTDNDDPNGKPFKVN